MTQIQQRITLAVSVIVGLTLLVITGLTFLVQPLTQDLALSDKGAELALIAPTIASLLVVFIAGRAGDQFGQRRTIVAAAAIFTLGAVVLATAQSQNGVIIGLGLCGTGAIVIQVVALSLLQRTAPDGEARTAAFTTYGAVFPIAFLIFPIATAHFLSLVNWRWVPVLWAIAGIVIIVISMLILERDEALASSGEWVSPILAGIALMAGTRALVELGERPSDSRIFTIFAALVGVIIFALTVVMKKAAKPGFSLRPLQGSMMWPLMIGVALVALLQILTYVSIAIEYMYGMTPIKASLVIAPAQLGAVIGAKFVAGWSIDRWGVERSGRDMLLATGTTILLLVVMQPSTSMWYLVVVSTLFSLTGMAALTILNLDIMGRAPAEHTGAVSAFRSASSSVGTALSMAVLGVVVLSSVTISTGVTAVEDSQLFELAAGLRLNGYLGFFIAVAGWFFLNISARRSRTETEVETLRSPADDLMVEPTSPR